MTVKNEACRFEQSEDAAFQDAVRAGYRRLMHLPRVTTIDASGTVGDVMCKIAALVQSRLPLYPNTSRITTGQLTEWAAANLFEPGK
jgi:thymidylate kinase